MVFSVAQTVPEELEGGPPDSQTESGHKISIFIKPNILSDNDYHNIKKNGLESKAKTAFFNPSSKRCFNLNRKNKKQIFNHFLIESENGFSNESGNRLSNLV